MDEPATGDPVDHQSNLCCKRPGDDRTGWFSLEVFKCRCPMHPVDLECATRQRPRRTGNDPRRWNLHGIQSPGTTSLTLGLGKPDQPRQYELGAKRPCLQGTWTGTGPLEFPDGSTITASLDVFNGMEWLWGHERRIAMLGHLVVVV